MTYNFRLYRNVSLIFYLQYVCVKCNLYDDCENADKLIFHCHDCGICRRRADENTDYEHCGNCSMCHPIFKKVENIKLPFPEHKVFKILIFNFSQFKLNLYLYYEYGINYTYGFICLALYRFQCMKDAGLVPCSVCGKSLHDSIDEACLLACKHYVHRSCLFQFPEEKTNTVLQCPACGNW